MATGVVYQEKEGTVDIGLLFTKVFY